MDVLEGFKYTCPVCGKTFFCTNPKEYVYQRKIKFKKKKDVDRIYLCSYTCMRKHEKEFPTKFYNSVGR